MGVVSGLFRGLFGLKVGVEDFGTLFLQGLGLLRSWCRV